MVSFIFFNQYLYIFVSIAFLFFSTAFSQDCQFHLPHLCFADIYEEAEEESLARDYEELQASMRKLPPVQFLDEAVQPLGRGV